MIKRLFIIRTVEPRRVHSACTRRACCFGARDGQVEDAKFAGLLTPRILQEPVPGDHHSFLLTGNGLIKSLPSGTIFNPAQPKTVSKA